MATGTRSNRTLLSPPRKLEFFHRGRGAVVGFPVVERALSLALHRSWRGLALMGLQAEGGCSASVSVRSRDSSSLVALRSEEWCGDPSEVPPPEASVPGVPPVLRCGIASVHVPCPGHLGGGAQKTAACQSNQSHPPKTTLGRGQLGGEKGGEARTGDDASMMGGGRNIAAVPLL